MYHEYTEWSPVIPNTNTCEKKKISGLSKHDFFSLQSDKVDDRVFDWRLGPLVKSFRILPIIRRHSSYVRDGGQGGMILQQF